MVKKENCPSCIVNKIYGFGDKHFCPESYEKGAQDAAREIEKLMSKHKGCEALHKVDTEEGDSYYKYTCLAYVLKEIKEKYKV